MKLKRMGVSVEILKNTLASNNIMPSFRVTADGIPEDAVVCGVSLEDGRIIWLTIQSDTFPDVKEGDEIPLLIPMFERLERT
jgi:hypothetical protein